MTINEDIIRGECRTQPVAGLSDCGLKSFDAEAKTEAEGEETAHLDEAEAVGALCQTCGAPSSLELMNSETEAEVTAVRPHSAYDSDAAGGSTANLERSGNSVNMSIQAGGLDFKLDTRIDPNQQSIELAAKLELCLSMLAASQNRLEVAFVRIGQLEAELAVLRTIHGPSDKAAQAPPAEQDAVASRGGGSDLG